MAAAVHYALGLHNVSCDVELANVQVSVIMGVSLAALYNYVER
jgi:hypothetical protein